ncbi:MAG TPA: DUF3870 domain-containing protein [Spirochaetales bacterium]|nr:DUF3870 domain-containing protein [Spirochaetales bacterium]HPB64945.1 DUF3870 domain-containing protein [Spirochaetales bacterium]HPG85685.1 DUF3870 domain-containing protein [Spirochaetales bacterium]
MYDPSTIYVVGNAKTNTENAITTLYNSFYIGFVLDPATGRIVDASCSATIRTTDEFVRGIFVGKAMGRDDASLDDEVRRRYHGSSQKAILVAYKDAAKKLAEIQARLGTEGPRNEDQGTAARPHIGTAQEALQDGAQDR